jgi:N-acetylneuraminate synthase
MKAVYIIAEIGINHQGSLEVAKRLIDAAKACGADAVKFQKRTVETVYSAEELAKPRESVFGGTNGDLKRGLEFSFDDYTEIDRYCRSVGIAWSGSAWDVASVHFLASFGVPWLKVPSALVTDHEVLRAYRNTGIPIYLSTGMSTLEECDAAVETLWPEKIAAVLHCHSSYPSPLDELNLACIQSFKDRYDLPVGYSSHTVSPWPCLMAVCYGAEVVEAHLTLDRAMWGSDQAASLEPAAFGKLVEEIRTFERAKGDGVKRVWPSEEVAKAKLRKVTA